MVYVLVLYAFMLLCMSLSFRAFMRHIRRELDAGRTLRAVCTAMVPAMLLGLPMALEVIRTVRVEGGMPELSDVEVKDVKCTHGVIVFRAVETGTATYRCPAAVVIRPHSASPFIPWPSYTEGDSQQLAAAIKALHKSAEKP